MTTTITPITISPQAETVLNHRYYLKDRYNESVEDAPAMFRRVAKAIAAIEDQYYTLPVEKELLETEFYNIMANLEFIPNS